MKKKILITGGRGYIGSVLAVNLKKKYSIYALDKVDRNFFVKKKINYIKCNLLNYSKTRKIIEKIKPEIIIHLAAQSTVDFIISKKNLYDLNNIKATQNIVRISKKLKIKKFIFASTAACLLYTSDAADE